jgi:N-methylhydantoinase A
VEGGLSLDDAVIGRRPVYLDPRRGWREAVVYQRERLPVATPFAGPAIVNEMSSTTLVLEGQGAVVDRFGNLVVQVTP